MIFDFVHAILDFRAPIRYVNCGNGTPKYSTGTVELLPQVRLHSRMPISHANGGKNTHYSPKQTIGSETWLCKAMHTVFLSKHSSCKQL